MIFEKKWQPRALGGERAMGASLFESCVTKSVISYVGGVYERDLTLQELALHTLWCICMCAPWGVRECRPPHCAVRVRPLSRMIAQLLTTH